ncbi:MAG: glycine--tRNA ligase [Candidatus Aenigmatarchaeota archaeon]
MESKLEKIYNLCLRRGIIFPTAEIYGSLAGFYDYGEIGLRIKQKLIALWKKFFKEDNFVEIEGNLVLPRKVVEASGHLERFSDPITKCKKCGKVYRADNLIEELLGMFVEGKSISELTKIIRENNIRCKECNGELEDVKEFNLMLKTFIGSLDAVDAYLRPETAQNIFIDFKRIAKAYRKKLPFAIIQVGYAFRNEISPRQFLIRMRSFTQAEIEMFFNPQDEKCPIEKYLNVEIPLLTREAQRNKEEKIVWLSIKELLEKEIIKSEWQAYFLAKEFLFFTQILKFPKEKIRFRHVLEEETPFYSAGNFDLEYFFDEIGWKEIVGNAYRTNYDLSTHMKHSGENLEFEGIIPHVAEPSFGIDRIILAIFFDKLREDREWLWLDLPKEVAPYLVAVFPLVRNKEEIVNKAKEVYEFLKKHLNEDVIFDMSDSIGKLYARADEIGIPYCITIDYQTLQDNTVTIRDRNTKQQVRVKVEEIIDFLHNK